MLRPSQRYFANENLDPRLRAGLVGHWVGDGSGLTLRDRSGRNNHGSLLGGPRWTLGEGGKRSCLSFDGTDDYVAIPSLQANPAPGSFACWVFCRSFAARPAFFAVQNTGAIDNWVVFGAREGTGKLYVQSYYNIIGYNDIIHSDNPLPLNAWTHVAISSNGSAYTLWIDGVAQSLTVLGGSNSGRWFDGVVSPEARIGYLNSTYPQRMSGEIDSVCIYNSALSKSEISLLAHHSFLPVMPRRWCIGAIPQRRRSISISGSRASYSLQGSPSSHSISGSRSSYLIEGS